MLQLFEFYDNVSTEVNAKVLLDKDNIIKSSSTSSKGKKFIKEINIQEIR